VHLTKAARGTSPKGHGSEYGMVIPTLATAAEAPAFIDARIAETAATPVAATTTGLLSDFDFGFEMQDSSNCKISCRVAA
jgi:hypothetical protein